LLKARVGSRTKMPGQGHEDDRRLGESASWHKVTKPRFRLLDSKSPAWVSKVHVLIGGELSDTPENMAELGSNSW
jgi:hypothetical protein